MKIKSIFSLVLASMMLIACNKNDEYPEGGPAVSEGAVAYVSVQIATEAATRAPSEEDAGANENDLKTIYLITFDGTDNVMGIPGSSNYFVKIEGGSGTVSTTPEAQKVSAKAKKMLVIANPGDELEGVLYSLHSASTFAEINAAIAGITSSEVSDDVTNITKGFTMINSGDETGVNVGSKITDPLIDIEDKMVVVDENDTDLDTEAKAKAKAEEAGSRVPVKIERLAAKIELKTASTIVVPNDPVQAKFDFGNWTVDGLNSTFFPFAEKTLLGSHTSTLGFYTNNFYTKDPNYDTNTGIDFAVIQPDYSPLLPHGTDWLAAGIKTYTIENTMEKEEQLFQNATRVVIKGTYYPDENWSGDWFSFAGKNYETLALLQAAYDEAATGSNLAVACDKMYNKIADYYTNVLQQSLSASDFSSLTTGHLSAVSNGGEVIKDGKNAVIHWYQGGLNYYYYEIRHADTDAHMAFGKYGVVRNNWYSLTLNSVSGPGTPWYPDIDNPGPGDPDPTDPIDEESGYLGIDIQTAPWIIWDRGIDL